MTQSGERYYILNGKNISGPKASSSLFENMKKWLAGRAERIHNCCNSMEHINQRATWAESKKIGQQRNIEQMSKCSNTKTPDGKSNSAANYMPNKLGDPEELDTA